MIQFVDQSINLPNNSINQEMILFCIQSGTSKGAIATANTALSACLTFSQRAPYFCARFIVVMSNAACALCLAFWQIFGRDSSSAQLDLAKVLYFDALSMCLQHLQPGMFVHADEDLM